jgi:hypothetical protein
MPAPLGRSSTDLAPSGSTLALSRRTFLGGTAALGATMLVSPKVAAAATTTFSAAALYDSIGICTHPCWRTTNWGTVPWENALISSGVRHTRGDLGHGAGADSGMTHLSKFFATGGKLCAFITGETLDKTSAQADITYLATKVGAQHLSGIESVNEYNNPNTRPINWASQLKAFQTWLYGTVKANSALKTVPVVAPSMWCQVRADYLSLGNLEPNINMGCMHYYPGGLRPTLANVTGSGTITIQQAVANAHILGTREQLYATEFGYDTPGPNRPLSGWVVTQRAAAKYIVRGLFDLFTNGTQKTFIYELMDDPGKNHYWGLCDANLNPKPAFTALKNTVALIKDNYVRLSSLGYMLSSAPADLKQYVFSKSDGSYLLVLYRDIDSYNRSTYRDIDAVPIYVVVKLSVTARKIEVFRPTFESTSQGSATGNSIMVPVDDQVTIVKITP